MATPLPGRFQEVMFRGDAAIYVDNIDAPFGHDTFKPTGTGMARRLADKRKSCRKWVHFGRAPNTARSARERPLIAPLPLQSFAGPVLNSVEPPAWTSRSTCHTKRYRERTVFFL